MPMTNAAPQQNLLGRARESEVLDHLAARVRSGQGQILVLRGEPGAGKTVLLDYLAQHAAGCQIARSAGAEPEAGMAFAGLHHLCAPFLSRLDHLPGPQREALRIAFSMQDGDTPDGFTVGLAVLSLLSEVARERPLICAVDDAQWLDRASAQTLAFVARRLTAEPAALVFAVRQPGGGHILPRHPELVVGGLAESSAHALLHSAVIGILDDRVRDRMVAEARGNPRALLELSRLAPDELAGGFGLPSAVQLPGPIRESYQERLATLPPATQRLLLVAAAELTGDPVLVWRAVSQLGIEVADAGPAVAAGLIELTGRVRFCDPQARAAIYQLATLPQLQEAHRVLSVATDPNSDPDRWAWHRAHATFSLDEDTSAALESATGRAQARGGLGAVAAFWQRAAELTPDPARRAQRALNAAQAKHAVGGQDAALRLLAIAQTGPLDESGQARAELLQARTAARLDRALLLLKAGDRLKLLDAGLAGEVYRDAFDATIAAGRLAAGGGLRHVAETVLTAWPAPRSSHTGELLLRALATLVTEGHATGGPALRRALCAIRHQGAPEQDPLGWLLFATRMCQVVWDDATWDALGTRLITLARRTGALAVLPAALAGSVAIRLAAGDLTAAAALAGEAEKVARATGDPTASWGSALVAAWRGQEAETRRLVASPTVGPAGREDGYGLTAAAWATAVLGNGLGRYDEALAAAEQASEDPDELGLATWSLAELIEAAVRTGSPERAAEAMQRLEEATSGAATDWALGVQARSRALLIEGTEAEPLYDEAIQRLARTRARAELARAHLLYGEWLRRQGRRRDAREQLRLAHQLLDAMGMAAFAERARRELMAAGEVVRRRAIGTVDELTAQEAQIAWLAVNGNSNPEIGTQLFISPRTVEWHLRKVFTKLGIGSRKELRAALPDLDRVRWSA